MGIFFYIVRLPGIGACLQTKRKALGDMENVMINRARYKQIKLNPGFGNKNVTGGLRDSRFNDLVREEAEGRRVRRAKAYEPHQSPGDGCG